MQMDFFRISDTLRIPEDEIEALCVNDTLPVRRYVTESKEQEKCFATFSISRGAVRCVIINVRGEAFLTRNYPKFYFQRLDHPEFFRTDSGCYINKKHIAQILEEKNSTYRRMFDRKKKENSFLDLSRGRAIGRYLIMTSGMVYACHSFRDASKAEERKDSDDEQE